MQTLVKVQARVQPGNRIEVQSPSLHVGALVDVEISSKWQGPRPDETPDEWSKRFHDWVEGHDKETGHPPAEFHRSSHYEEME